MKWTRFAGLTVLLLAGCSRTPSTKEIPVAKPRQRPDAADPVMVPPTAGPNLLVEARKGFKTKPVRRTNEKEPVPQPPANLFQIVHYDSAVGKLPAYLTPDPKDGKKHPAIVWVTGGDCNSIGDDVWKDAPPSNDQTASAFRKAGIVMMFPSLRGGNENPGQREGFFGEVDDVIAAADFLSKQDFVDPKRVYLGGHSTGGTLVLLTAECTDRFRATFSFGPVDNPIGYPAEFTPFDTDNEKELRLRAPILWLGEARAPVFVFEGGRQGNGEAVQTMQRQSKNPNVHFLIVRQANHFSILAPVTKLLADKVLADTGPTCNIEVSMIEVNRPSQSGRRPAGKGE
jgi:dienelactone hydrolase